MKYMKNKAKRYCTFHLYHTLTKCLTCYMCNPELHQRSISITNKIGGFSYSKVAFSGNGN